MKAKAIRIIATRGDGTASKVQLAVESSLACELTKAGYPSRFTAWVPAANAKVGTAYASVSVVEAQAARVQPNPEGGEPASFPAETVLHVE